MDIPETQDWNYDEFITFVMIYASNVDMDFSDQEKEKIHLKVKQATFDKMYKEFDKRSDFESLQTILSYKGLYYPTSDRKLELLNSIKMLFFADGEYTPMEKELMHFFEKLM